MTTEKLPSETKTESSRDCDDIICVNGAVAGGRSRLHLLDLGSCSRGKDGTALSLSALGTVLLALFNGQRHLPYRYCTLVIHSTAVCGSCCVYIFIFVHRKTVESYNKACKHHRLK